MSIMDSGKWMLCYGLFVPSSHSNHQRQKVFRFPSILDGFFSCTSSTMICPRCSTLHVQSICSLTRFSTIYIYAMSVLFWCSISNETSYIVSILDGEFRIPIRLTFQCGWQSLQFQPTSEPDPSRKIVGVARKLRSSVPFDRGDSDELTTPTNSNVSEVRVRPRSHLMRSGFGRRRSWKIVSIANSDG